MPATPFASVAHLIIGVALDERHPGPDSLLIVHILLLEETEQCDFFDENAIVEEFPAGHRIEDYANRIAEHNLCADGPPKPAGIRRMAHVRVHTVRNQAMVVSLLILHDMIEIRMGRDDGRFAQQLAGNAQRHAEAQNGQVILQRRIEVHFHGEFGPAEQGRQLIGPRVVQHEGVNVQRAWIRRGDGQILRKVEERDKANVGTQVLPWRGSGGEEKSAHAEDKSDQRRPDDDLRIGEWISVGCLPYGVSWRRYGPPPGHTHLMIAFAIQKVREATDYCVQH